MGRNPGPTARQVRARDVHRCRCRFGSSRFSPCRREIGIPGELPNRFENATNCSPNRFRSDDPSRIVDQLVAGRRARGSCDFLPVSGSDAGSNDAFTLNLTCGRDPAYLATYLGLWISADIGRQRVEAHGMEEVRSSILLSSTENPRSQASKLMAPRGCPLQLTPCGDRFQAENGAVGYSSSRCLVVRVRIDPQLWNHAVAPCGVDLTASPALRYWIIRCPTGAQIRTPSRYCRVVTTTTRADGPGPRSSLSLALAQLESRR
jgi:hypothetical protein